MTALSKTLPKPDLAPDAPGRPATPRYRRQYGVIVLLPDEATQLAAFEALRAQGYTCKVVVT